LLCDTGACGAAGSAPAWHAGGQGFESPQVHTHFDGGVSVTTDPLAKRQDYGSLSLEEGACCPTRLSSLTLWVKEADDAEIYEPNAMVLSTIDPDGEPSSRTVLLRGIDEHGLVFLHRLRLSQRVSPCWQIPLFRWYFPGIGNTARFSSTVTPRPLILRCLTHIFETRPRGSQIGAWSSEQSRPIDSSGCLGSKSSERWKLALRVRIRDSTARILGRFPD
jgi:pyridoxamine 5'-phosphate oxidase